MRKYYVKYTDQFGEEETEITTDGSTMHLKLRGIAFEGDDFEALEGKVDKSKFDYTVYEDGSGDLTNFRMEVIFPIKIYHQNIIVTEKLAVIIETGEELEIKGLDSIVNSIELDASFGKFKSTKKVEWFEDAIIDIQNRLPENTQIQTCLSCKYSNYHPCGNGMFGALHCFKNIKKQLKMIIDKHDLMSLWTKEAIQKGEVFNVQEVFDCPDHQFITKKDWTYKDWDYRTKCVK